MATTPASSSDKQPRPQPQYSVVDTEEHLHTSTQEDAEDDAQPKHNPTENKDDNENTVETDEGGNNEGGSHISALSQPNQHSMHDSSLNLAQLVPVKVIPPISNPILPVTIPLFNIQPFAAMSVPLSSQSITTFASGIVSSAHIPINTSSDVIRQIIRGSNFVKYESRQTVAKDSLPPQPTIAKKAIFLYFSPNSGHTGSLFWCRRGKRTKNPARSLPLHQITDLFVGKRTKVFKSTAAVDAPLDCCFSLYGNQGQRLHLQADSSEQLTNWLSAFNFLLSGKVIVKNKPTQTVV